MGNRASTNSGCSGVEDYVYQGIDIGEIAVQVFLLHPVIVEVGMARLGDAVGGPDEGVVQTFGQFKDGVTAVSVLAVG